MWSAVQQNPAKVTVSRLFFTMLASISPIQQFWCVESGQINCIASAPSHHVKKETACGLGLLGLRISCLEAYIPHAATYIEPVMVPRLSKVVGFVDLTCPGTGTDEHLRSQPENLFLEQFEEILWHNWKSSSVLCFLPLLGA
jgi:hypothetical protein